MLFPIGKAVVREGLETTNRALTKTLTEDQPPVEALKSESKRAVRNLYNKADLALKQQGIGSRKRPVIVVRNKPVKRSRDIFGHV